MNDGTSTTTQPPTTPSHLEREAESDVGLILVLACVILLIMGVFLMIFGDGGRNR